MKKHIALLIVLVFTLTLFGNAALAEAADNFLDDLGKAWDSFLVMANEAGQSASAWADENGVTEWAQGVADDFTAWADENGVTEWAQGLADDLSEWAQGAVSDIQAFVDENGPAVEAWLNQAGEDVRRAWDTLANADEHSKEEVRQALETVTEALEEESAADQTKAE